MKYECLVIAGEKSGEEHSLSFLLKMKELNPEIHFFGVGGDELQAHGMELLYHLKDFSSWGIGEVIHKIPFYLQAEKKIIAEVKSRGCKTAILVDFQDFNLRLAKKLKKSGVNVLYYVAPQAWAWKAWRTKALARSVHTLFTIIPFEKKWFLDRGVKQVRGVVHPLLLTYQNELKDLPRRPFSDLKPTIKLLILPGSRNAEVKNLLPLFLETSKLLRDSFNLSLSIVKTTSVEESLYEYYLEHFDQVYTSEELPKALKNAHICLAASGTVTLATALFEVPTVVAYKGSLLTQYIYNNFISYSGPISLANIVHEERLFPELIQDDAQPVVMMRQLLPWLTSELEYEKIKNKLRSTKDKISGESFNLPEYMNKVILGN